MAEAKNRMERQYRIYKAEKEAMEKGRTDEKLEVARKMKDMGFPVAQIVK